jgi:hypothetical protein
VLQVLERRTQQPGSGLLPTRARWWRSSCVCWEM